MTRTLLNSVPSDEAYMPAPTEGREGEFDVEIPVTVTGYLRVRVKEGDRDRARAVAEWLFPDLHFGSAKVAAGLRLPKFETIDKDSIELDVDTVALAEPRREKWQTTRIR